MGLLDIRSVGAKVYPARKVYSIAYNQSGVTWNTSGNTIIDIPGILLRNAQDRTFYLYNNLGVAISLVQIYIYDSNLPNQNVAGDSYYDSSPSLSANKIYVAGSKGGKNGSGNGAAYLGNIGDSIALIMNTGATAPASGSFDIWVAERL